MVTCYTGKGYLCIAIRCNKEVSKNKHFKRENRKHKPVGDLCVWVNVAFYLKLRIIISNGLLFSPHI